MGMRSVELIQFLEVAPDFVEVGLLPGAEVELRYASENNFMNENIYGEFVRAFLHVGAAEKFERAIGALQRKRAGCRFLLLDCLRPRWAQWELWRRVEGTPEERYVANPERGSMHNFGVAVDLTVIDEAGAELDMGAGFDEFSERAEPRNEERLLAEGVLSATQVENRLLLRESMEEAGFFHIPHEWWHFDSEPDSAFVRANFAIVE